MAVVELTGKSAHPWEEALLVQERQDAGALGRACLKQVHADLVVLKVHMRPVDALGLVRLLLHLEQVPAQQCRIAHCAALGIPRDA